MTIYRDGQSDGGGLSLSEEMIKGLMQSANKDLLEEIGMLIATRSAGLPAGSRMPIKDDDPEVLRQLAREMASTDGNVESNFSDLGKTTEVKGDEADDDIINILADMGEDE